MDFFEFLNTAVTPGLAANYEPAKAYFVCREGSVIAFRTPKQWCDTSKFRIALAHTDFPTLKISPNPDGMNAGVCTLHTEVYGSPLYTSWLDRDLGYAGMLAYVDSADKSNTLKTKLFRGDKLFRIPQLAVHLNRGVNQDGLKVNPQVDFNALWTGASGSSVSENRKNLFVKALEKELPEGARLIDFDVQLFDAQPANRGGFNDEWIYSGRLEPPAKELPVTSCRVFWILSLRSRMTVTLECASTIGPKRLSRQRLQSPSRSLSTWRMPSIRTTRRSTSRITLHCWAKALYSRQTHKSAMQAT